MSRTVLSLSLSEELFERMLEHWTEAGYASSSEYIRELIRNDLRQNASKQDPYGVPKVRFKNSHDRWGPSR